MFFWRKGLLALTTCAFAMPVAAQAPAPATTAFDGKYVGTATVLGGGRGLEQCDPIISEEMIIIGGEVIIQEILFNNRGRPRFRGNISATGEVSASHSWRTDRATGINSVSGIIRDRAFVGERRTGYWCYYRLQMGKVTGSTTAFDGKYIGVSR